MKEVMKPSKPRFIPSSPRIYTFLCDYVTRKAAEYCELSRFSPLEVT